MMETKSYLIFSLQGYRYAIEATAVQEIFFLPEVSLIPEAPRYLVGLINLRGTILPVMDLNRRWGKHSSDYQVTDSVIVLEWQNSHLGVIVNQVYEVQLIEAANIENNVTYIKQSSLQEQRFISGIAKVNQDIIIVIDPEVLFTHADELDHAIAKEIEEPSPEQELEPETRSHLVENRYFCPHATPEERGIFHQRAEQLRSLTESEDFTGLIPLAVIGLNGEYFGLELGLVREFTQISKITPIPCTPPHVIGNMNLRGEIVTLIDIRSYLNLPVNRYGSELKAMVLHLDQLVAGVIVDEVYDVMYLNPAVMTRTPAAVNAGNEEYLRGTAPYQDKMMTIVDMSKLLTNDDLVVNEEV